MNTFFSSQRFANSGSGSGDDRFDSWRTQQRYQANADYYYDQKLSKGQYPQPKSYGVGNSFPPHNETYLDNYQPHYHPSYSNHHHSAHPNAMGMYTYNSRRYHRDYDPEF